MYESIVMYESSFQDPQFLQLQEASLRLYERWGQAQADEGRRNEPLTNFTNFWTRSFSPSLLSLNNHGYWAECFNQYNFPEDIKGLLNKYQDIYAKIDAEDKAEITDEKLQLTHDKFALDLKKLDYIKDVPLTGSQKKLFKTEVKKYVQKCVESDSPALNKLVEDYYDNEEFQDPKEFFTKAQEFFTKVDETVKKEEEDRKKEAEVLEKLIDYCLKSKDNELNEMVSKYIAQEYPSPQLPKDFIEKANNRQNYLLLKQYLESAYLKKEDSVTVQALSQDISGYRDYSWYPQYFRHRLNSLFDSRNDACKDLRLGDKMNSKKREDKKAILDYLFDDKNLSKDEALKRSKSPLELKDEPPKNRQLLKGAMKKSSTDNIAKQKIDERRKIERDKLKASIQKVISR
jgi:hypothetical protein